MENSFGSLDKLCQDCDAIFDQHTVEIILNSPGAPVQGSPKEHLRYQVLQISAQACRLCEVILENVLLLLGKSSTCEVRGDVIAVYIVAGIGMLSLYGGDLNLRLQDMEHCNLYLSPLSSQKIENIVQRRNINGAVPRITTVRQIQAWQDTCKSSHPICESAWKDVSTQRRLPTRMIDVSKLCVVDSVFLPTNTPYLTLSHCWGKNPSFIRLTSTTYQEYYDVIPWTSLPQTFKDAIELTRSLGFRYVWIDALCIVQDSKSDWKYEAALMGDVYAHGHLNIAATTSNSGAGGILPRDSRPFPDCLIRLNDAAGNSHIFRTHTGEVFPRNIEDPLLAPLGNRAWVVQERLLSPRILHFVSDQVFWECCCSVWAELFDNDYLLNADSVKKLMGLNRTSDTPHSASELYHGWIDIVARYSQCGLTQKLDKLPAISGIARRMRRQLGVSQEAYLAGLWRETLPLRLLWFSFTQKGESSHFRYLERAPSWSWSCIEGPIEFCRFHRETEFRSRVLEARTFHDGDPFGQVSGGSLVLQAPICELASFGYPRSNGVFDMLRTPPAFAADEIQWDSPETKQAMQASKAVLLFLAVEGVVYYGVLHVSGLVLCSTGEKRDQYRRVGMIGHGRMRNYQGFLDFTTKSGEFGFRNFDPNFGYVIEIA